MSAHSLVAEPSSMRNESAESPVDRVVIKHIESLNELSPLEKYVLVAFGKTDAIVQEGKRFVILVNPEPLSDHLAHCLFRIATESAKLLAKREEIETICLCPRLIRHNKDDRKII